MEVAEKVKEIIAEQLGLEVEEIKDDSSLQDFNPDSLDIAEIIMELEDNFDGISIPDEEAQTLTTVDKIVKYIEKKKKSLQEAT